MQLSLTNTLSTASCMTLGLALALSLGSSPAQADSTSSASSAASTSVGSASTSLETSSAGSSGKGQVAQGDYTVVEVAALAGLPELIRVRLHAATHGLTPEFALLLPRQTFERAYLSTGQTVRAEHRPYGLAFTAQADHGATPRDTQAFFLVLDDAWHRELQSRPVGITAPAASS